VNTSVYARRQHPCCLRSCNALPCPLGLAVSPGVIENLQTNKAMNELDVQLQASEKLFKDITALQDKVDRVFNVFNDWKKVQDGWASTLDHKQNLRWLYDKINILGGVFRGTVGLLKGPKVLA